MDRDRLRHGTRAGAGEHFRRGDRITDMEGCGCAPVILKALGVTDPFPHGTYAGALRHYRLGDKAEDMRECGCAEARARRERERPKKARPPRRRAKVERKQRELPPHGTSQRARWHKRQGDRMADMEGCGCAEAFRAHERARMEAKRRAAGIKPRKREPLLWVDGRPVWG